NNASSPTTPVSASRRVAITAEQIRKAPVRTRKTVALSGGNAKLRTSTAATRTTRAQTRYRGQRGVSTESLPVEIKRVAPSLAVIGDVLHFLRRPCLELEIVRHHARAFFQLFVQ